MTTRHPASDPRYLNIGEVAQIVNVAPHVLRYWEKEFPQIRPMKRGGNRRFYRPGDVDTLLRIRHLLYDRRFTISGAREHLRQSSDAAAAGGGSAQELLDDIHRELLDLHRSLTAGSPDVSGHE
ncbi:MAG: MerR family transcriptional regulator [Magnetococcales bacterium]|nr:MerR family transcriptional regulator [Magnetococcales bacterium]